MKDINDPTFHMDKQTIYMFMFIKEMMSIIYNLPKKVSGIDGFTNSTI